MAHVEAHRGRAERDGEMREARVHADDARSRGRAAPPLRERHGGRGDRPGGGRREPRRIGALRGRAARIAPRRCPRRAGAPRARSSARRASACRGGSRRASATTYSPARRPGGRRGGRREPVVRRALGRVAEHGAPRGGGCARPRAASAAPRGPGRRSARQRARARCGGRSRRAAPRASRATATLFRSPCVSTIQS